MLDVIFERHTPHGYLVAVAVRAELFDSLFDEERAFAANFAAKRRAVFASGRAAMRHALARYAAAGPVLADDRGAPVLPLGFSGSISHKDTLAVALVAEAEEGVAIGVDVEVLGAVKPEHARLILRDGERVPNLTVAMSLKEALYKAIDPFVRRFVGFKEVSVTIEPDGVATFRLFDDAYRADGLWVAEHGHVVSSVLVEKR